MHKKYCWAKLRKIVRTPGGPGEVMIFMISMIVVNILDDKLAKVYNNFYILKNA
jgi:hypothetical protein